MFARALHSTFRMKTMLISIIFLVVQSASAQETDDPARPSLGKTGQLFTIKLTPKSKRLDIKLAGHEAASLDPGRLVVFGRIVGDGETRVLRIEPAGGHFRILDEIEPGSQIEIEVKDRSTNKSEKLRVHSKP